MMSMWEENKQYSCMLTLNKMTSTLATMFFVLDIFSFTDFFLYTKPLNLYRPLVFPHVENITPKHESLGELQKTYNLVI